MIAPPTPPTSLPPAPGASDDDDAPRVQCAGVTPAGKQCRKHPTPGRQFCAFHSDAPSDRARRRSMGRRGGRARARGAAPTSAAIGTVLDVATLDLTSARGVMLLLAGLLRQLAVLPTDAKLAHAMGAVAGVQRNVIQVSDLDERLRALEAANDDPRADDGDADDADTGGDCHSDTLPGASQ